MVPNTGIKASSPRDETSPEHLRLAFYLHNKSNVEHVLCHFSPYLNFTGIFYDNHSLI